MKKIEKTLFTIIAAVAATTILAFAVGCGSESPSAAPAEAADPQPAAAAAPSAAVQAPEDAEAVADPANEPDIVDFMDAETDRMFQAMNSDWQRMVRDSWGFITTIAPQDDWQEAAGDIVSQMYADAKIKGGTRDALVEGVQDLVDPSKGPSQDQTGTDSPPFILGLLPPKYREAYQIIPEGSLMREYMDRRLGSFSQEGWEAINRQPDEPYPQPAPELDAGEEFELTRMIRTAGGEEWFIGRLQGLEADAAREFQAAGDVEERLGVLRRLVEVEGKEDGVMEIRAEWQARSAGFTDAQIADYVQLERDMAAEGVARSRMTPTQRYLNHAESFICGDLMNHIVGQHPRTAASGPAECDIDKVIALTRAALDAGQSATSEEEFRTAIEYYEETGQWRFSVTWSSPEGELERQCMAFLPDPSADGGNVGEFTNFMDEELQRLFRDLSQTAQCELLGMWLGITTAAPREDWEMILGDLVRDFPGRIEEAQSAPDSPPFILGLLPPKYREAYQIIPEGSLMREYMDSRLGSFSQEGWEAINRQPDEPYPQPAPELDAGEEFDLTRMIRTAGGEEWFIGRLQGLEADAAREFQAAGDVEERLGVLRRLVEIEGKEDGVMEIRAEWQARSAGFTDAQIADYVQLERDMAAEGVARSRMTPTQRYLNHAESFICGDLMNHIVGQHPRTAASSPAECDIDKVIALTRAALDAGQAATSEEEFRTAIEYYEETGQWRFSVTRSGPEGE